MFAIYEAVTLSLFLLSHSLSSEISLDHDETLYSHHKTRSTVLNVSIVTKPARDRTSPGQWNSERNHKKGRIKGCRPQWQRHLSSGACWERGGCVIKGWVDGFRRCEAAIFTHSVCDLGWSRPCGSGVTAFGQWVERKCTAVLPAVAAPSIFPRAL